MYTTLLSPILYAPPLIWWVWALQANKVLFETNESFPKSTLRNRCKILGSQGSQYLSIPIEGGRSHKQIYNSVQCAAAINWQKQHWHALQTNYASAPFFEHYGPEIEQFYVNPASSLINFNLQIIKFMASKLKLDVEFDFTQSFSHEYDETFFDARNFFKNQNSPTIQFTEPYCQVFADRLPFDANLSIFDILFNEGPSCAYWLKNQISRNSLHHLG